MGNNNEHLISTIIQLRIVKAILRLTEKRKREFAGFVHKSEIAYLANVKFSTLDQFLERLEKMNVIEYLPHIKQWKGTFRLTKNGEVMIKTELQELLKWSEEPELTLPRP